MATAGRGDVTGFTTLGNTLRNYGAQKTDDTGMHNWNLHSFHCHTAPPAAPPAYCFTAASFADCGFICLLRSCKLLPTSLYHGRQFCKLCFRFALHRGRLHDASSAVSPACVLQQRFDPLIEVTTELIVPAVLAASVFCQRLHPPIEVTTKFPMPAVSSASVFCRRMSLAKV